MAKAKFIVITPARNEAEYIGKTIESLVSQSVLPAEWVIVDDGSSDETAAIAATAARSYPWIKVLRLKDRGYRDFGCGDVEAFCYGITQISANDYQFIFKIDADIVLGRNYFNLILDKFAQDPQLGIAAGEVDEVIGGKPLRLRALPLAKAGAVKGWRRECFEARRDPVQTLGWDGIDSFKAMMVGWKAITFQDEALSVIHLRPMGASDPNIYRRWARHGQALYFMGAHPLWVLASALYHLLDPPYVTGAMCLLGEYLKAALKGAEQYNDAEFKRFLRHWQLRKLAQVLRLE